MSVYFALVLLFTFVRIYYSAEDRTQWWIIGIKVKVSLGDLEISGSISSRVEDMHSWEVPDYNERASSLT